MKLIISEKPSLAKAVANAVGAKNKHKDYYEGNGFIVAHSVGHIYEMVKPDKINPKYKKWSLDDLPILPDTIPKQLKKEFIPLFKTIKSLADRNDITEIVNNGDSDAEGQLLLQEILDGIKTKKPVKRLWNTSLAAPDIRKAVISMKPNSQYEDLLKSAEARSELDWLYGMNMSRLMSIRGNAVLPVGRVQTPLLNFICIRANEVEHFVPVPYYIITASDGSLTLNWHGKDKNERLKTRQEADEIANKLRGKTGKILSAEKKEKHLGKFNIYDTNRLQIDAERLFHFPASKTAEIMERLYNAGILSYPRTDSSYLLEDMVVEFNERIEDIKRKIPAVGQIMKNLKPSDYKNSYIFNDKKVDEHAGIILTSGYSSAAISPSSDEGKILSLVIARMLEVCLPTPTYYEVKVEAEVEGEHLGTTAASIKDKGYLVIREKLLGRAAKIPKPLPSVKAGQPFTARKTETVEKLTKSPHYYTEAELLNLMKNVAREAPEKYRKILKETDGLGTAATRTQIIQSLYDRGYTVKQGRNIIPTGKGKYLIANVTEEMKSPVFTAVMEDDLAEIRKGKLDKTNFMAKTRLKLTDIIASGKKASIVPLSRTPKYYRSKPKNFVGICPRCGKDVIECKNSWSCVGFKDKSCSFGIWKDNAFFKTQKKKLTTTMVKKLLQKGSVYVSGLVSRRTHKKYDAIISLKDNGQKTSFAISFPKRRPKK